MIHDAPYQDALRRSGASAIEGIPSTYWRVLRPNISVKGKLLVVRRTKNVLVCMVFLSLRLPIFRSEFVSTSFRIHFHELISFFNDLCLICLYLIYRDMANSQFECLCSQSKEVANVCSVFYDVFRDHAILRDLLPLKLHLITSKRIQFWGNMLFFPLQLWHEKGVCWDNLPKNTLKKLTSKFAH